MNITKREKIMVGAAGGVLVIALVYQFVIDPAAKKKARQAQQQSRVQTTKNPATTKPKPRVTTQGTQTKATESTAALKTDIQVFDDWGRDPFIKGSTTTQSRSSSYTSSRKSKPKYTLKAIFWKEGKPYALIDDDIILSEGEAGSSFTVITIKEKSVVCRQGGRTFSLYLKE